MPNGGYMYIDCTIIRPHWAAKYFGVNLFLRNRCASMSSKQFKERKFRSCQGNWTGSGVHRTLCRIDCDGNPQ